MRSISVGARDLRGDSIEGWIDAGFDAVHLRLLPREVGELGDFLNAASVRGLPVHAQVRLNVPEDARPDLERVNAFGEVDSLALCPSQPETQDRFLDAARIVDRHYAWASLLLDDVGFQGFPGRDFLGGICFCPACLYGLGAVGDLLRQIAIEGGPQDHPSVSTLLLWRRSVQYGLLRQFHEAVQAPICLRTAASVRYTGQASILSFEEAKGIAASCCVEIGEVERLRRLPRPMPVIAVVGRVQELDPMFSGMIVDSNYLESVT